MADGTPFFAGCSQADIVVGDVTLRVRSGGRGRGLLLHGHARTHATWHAVAARLAATHTVVCPDLRGYGASSKPAPAADHAAHSKRAMAADVVALMRRLGFERFSVIGHERGAHVALRLALDHPHAVERLGVIEAVPIGEVLARCGSEIAARWWHWFFYAQPERPERTIGADPLAWFGAEAERERMHPRAHAEWLAAIRDPRVVRALLEDHRAGLTIDRRHDDEDARAWARVRCPSLVLWALGGDLPALFGDPLDVWRDWARDLQGRGIACGHHVAEERPGELAEAWLTFERGAS